MGKKNNRKAKSRKSIIYGTPIYKYQTVVKVNRQGDMPYIDLSSQRALRLNLDFCDKIIKLQISISLKNEQ